MDLEKHDVRQSERSRLNGECNNEREHVFNTYQLISFVELENNTIELRGSTTMQ